MTELDLCSRDLYARRALTKWLSEGYHDVEAADAEEMAWPAEDYG